MNTRTRIWKRTRLYFVLMIVLYLATAALLIMTVGRGRVADNALMKKRSAMLQRDTARLGDLRRNLIAAGARKKVLDQALETETKRIAAERALLARIHENEKKPKNARNEKKIESALNADYAVLRGESRAPGALDLETTRLHWKMLVVVTIFLTGTAAIMFVLVFMILVPLEKIIKGVRRVNGGDLLVDFDVETGDEMSDLAEVLKDLTTNFRELLVLIRNSYESGVEIHDTLEKNEPGARESALGELENLCMRLKELTEYFQFRRP